MSGTSAGSGKLRREAATASIQQRRYDGLSTAPTERPGLVERPLLITR